RPAAGTGTRRGRLDLACAGGEIERNGEVGDVAAARRRAVEAHVAELAGRPVDRARHPIAIAAAARTGRFERRAATGRARPVDGDPGIERRDDGKVRRALAELGAERSRHRTRDAIGETDGEARSGHGNGRTEE